LVEIAVLSPAEALQRLSSGDSGLTANDAASRLKTIGLNEVAHEARQTILFEIFTRANNPLNILLLTLAASSYFLGDHRAAFVIAVMVALSISLGFIQEHRSSVAASALRRMVQNKATVLRHGGPGPQGDDVPIGQVVAGDIVLLSVGDMVPAVVRLISVKDLFVNQSRVRPAPNHLLAAARLDPVCLCGTHPRHEVVVQPQIRPRLMRVAV